MPTSDPSGKSANDIYVTFVETLFRDGKTLAIGVGSQSFLAVLVYYKTTDAIYLIIALALVASGMARFASMARFRRQPSPPRTVAEAKRWEKQYIILATLHSFTLGSFCFIAIYLFQDPFVEAAAVCVTLGSATGIAGRNYGSPRMVMILVVALIGPISAGFILRGDIYHFLLGVMSIPFLFAIRSYARNVRAVLFQALNEKKEVRKLATRFDQALNTAPHGLIMFGPDGRIVVANKEAGNLLDIRDAGMLEGRTLHSLMLRTVARGLLSRVEGDYLEQQLAQSLQDGVGTKVVASLTDGRHYEFTARAGAEELGVVTFEDVTARVTADEKIRFMAQYDSLTGLPNRGYFNDLVSGLLAEGDPQRWCGLAVVDLDDFKQINDTLGHPIGDGLIYAVADRLATLADDNTRLSRFGGDEFILYFDRLEDSLHLERELQRFFDGFREDVDVAGHMLRIQASAGAVIAPAEGADVENLVARADLALYRAKDGGKNRWRLFAADMDADFRARQILKAELREAVANNQLQIIYQPIVHLATRRIVGCEALCRWHHPEMGTISPSQFIPLAEQIGIVSDISAHVIRTACRACLSWPEHISVSINLSANDFHNRNVVEILAEVLRETGLEPHRLEVEITETAMVDDKALTIALLREIKQLGVRIALDDFGTGYSSLSYLHSLPLDKVKIDQAFLSDITHDERSLELLKGIILLSRRIGLEIALEGIEDQQQLRVINGMLPPDQLQGFLFGAALTREAIDTLARKPAPFEKHFAAAGMGEVAAV